jgi:tetratricopeptide (TPR) repeat protein
MALILPVPRFLKLRIMLRYSARIKALRLSNKISACGRSESCSAIHHSVYTRMSYQFSNKPTWLPFSSMKPETSRAPIAAFLLRALLLAAAAGSLPLAAMESTAETPAQPVPEAAGKPPVAELPDIQSYREAIEQLESGEGAYASALPEQLLSLGISLQRSGKHDEAVKLFKRGVHLSRINNGLYGAEQIALLQQEILSHIALGQYTAADERQHYMYRVQMRNMESGMGRAEAFSQQARWQYNAYRLDLGDAGYTRLMNMWDLYRLALNDIVDREGSTTPALLEPLEGMLLAQYLIADYTPQNGGSGFSSGESFTAQQQANRFNAYRGQTYQRGRAVIQAIYDVQLANHGENSIETARSLTMMGDWTLWHGEREVAMEAYQQATAELVANGAAQEEIDAAFAQPVALPNFDGARPLPESVAPGEDNLQLEFTVNARGKVMDLERVDENELNDGLVNRIMRKLRKTRFRPQLTMGEPVIKEKVARAYAIE